MARFGISPGRIRTLDGFESFIYEFVKDGRAYILRIGHSLRRTPELIHGEVDWINYLAAGGAGVASAVLSENGKLVELIADGRGGQFLATAFVKAKGGTVWQTDRWDERLFEQYGRLLGRIHHLSKTYQPATPAWKRPSWDDPMMLFTELYAPEEQTAVLSRYRDLLTYLHSLPQDSKSYGLIHQDAHGGNFFVDEEYNLTLFDFDDCVYSHFVNDIAIALFYAVTNHPEPEKQLTELWSPFWQGYSGENDLDTGWLQEIPHFMKLREIDLYAVLLDTFGPGSSGNEWIDTFRHGRRTRIENNIPYLDINWEAL
ncbi:MAG: phosphotransferase [Chloroflexi bacterium]|nr:phosphotransferase [Chloroflexota bacterium]